jgi:hypothetical protein
MVACILRTLKKWKHGFQEILKVDVWVSRNPPVFAHSGEKSPILLIIGTYVHTITLALVVKLVVNILSDESESG